MCSNAELGAKLDALAGRVDEAVGEIKQLRRDQQEASTTAALVKGDLENWKATRCRAHELDINGLKRSSEETATVARKAAWQTGAIIGVFVLAASILVPLWLR